MCLDIVHNIQEHHVEHLVNGVVSTEGSELLSNPVIHQGLLDRGTKFASQLDHFVSVDLKSELKYCEDAHLSTEEMTVTS